jgi:hypothetical protein
MVDCAPDRAETAILSNLGDDSSTQLISLLSRTVVCRGENGVWLSKIEKVVVG